ncbi:protein VAC14 homolog isoform X2 [Lycorma delicatula]|uniref:protein VAC14 homolog isoform X2 n=1 Tax=Lycorma delicatula TaxID=130591 RepID=UPI003F5153C6
MAVKDCDLLCVKLIFPFQDTSDYTEVLIRPILANFSDQDLRVRYYACESMYNVVKVARGAVLPHFTEIFSALSRLAADPDQNVKNGSELLDRLMKDIVTESATFDLVGFMPLLRERIYASNTFARQFVISWLAVLDAVPDIDLIIFLPEILDGIFHMLEDPTLEIKKMCDTVLAEFLRSIKQDPSRVDFPGMINILINHSQATDDLLQFTAITWIKEFVQLSKQEMLPFTSGILTAIFPCLAYDGDARKHIKETAKEVNNILLSFVELEKDFSDYSKQVDSNLNLQSVVDVLTKHLLHTSVQTKVAVLYWIYQLYIKIPNRMMEHVEVVFPVLLKVLSDSADKVVQHALQVLAEIISLPQALDNGDVPQSISGSLVQSTGGNNSYYRKFIISLLNQFSCNRTLLEERGSFIIRHLCVILNSEHIYCMLAEILLVEENLKFTSTMVEVLNTILLTSSELFELRTKLKEFNTEESWKLFLCLYNSWCHNPVATIALCLLTQNYTHVCELIRVFGSMEITVELLTEIDKLIQLIESPIFAYLRLELLEVPHNGPLVRALYGLLMLLPQAEAFHTLRNRLDCIPKLQLHSSNNQNAAVRREDFRIKKSKINFDNLVQHFITVQEKHRQHKLVSRKDELFEKGVKNID